ncbi:CRISPR-associated endonuclease Cas1 [Patescibacteria group bacterium]|nr:CRISPR-associated endonuclease Cas1 [Patescibacteria group bacterium]
MITLPDFKQKKILTVIAEYGQKNLLQLRNDNIRFIRDEVLVDQISLHLIFAVLIIGDMTITTSLIKKLSQNGISILFLNHNLSIKASAMTGVEGNYLLREKQYLDTNALEISKNFVINKIRSQEKILKLTGKQYEVEVFKKTIQSIADLSSNDELLGNEGNISKIYFGILFSEIEWVRRAPQTKLDIPNLLLDIGYSYLFNYCDALLKVFGFDTYKGYYHQLFFQRKSLSCDVMEPMRPIIDYQLLKSYHLGQIKPKDFAFKNGRFEFKDGFKTSKLYSSIFLGIINERKNDIYKYILGFYRYVMDNKKYKFPEFKV